MKPTAQCERAAGRRLPDMDSRRKPEVVVITGGSAGVGLATAKAFGRRAACLGLIARDREALEAAFAEVESVGGKAMPLPGDVSCFQQVEASALDVENKFGPIDIWVNNAMTTVFSPFHEITAEEFKRATEVTYLGAVYGTMVALKRMRRRNQGCIVQVGSALAYRSIPLQAPYCGAKHAIRGFTDSVRSELLHEKSRIHLTMVHLPALNTPQFSWCKTRLPHQPQPVPPIFQPELAARAIVWAAHHHRREVYVGGPTVKAIVANKLAPGLLDRLLAGRAGYDAQQTNGKIDPDRPDNLFEPVRGLHGARGIFDERARKTSVQFWGTRRRAWVGLAALATTAITAFWVCWRSRER
jgi:short-subunit dehydrogenase